MKIKMSFLLLQEYAETAMNELLGWYGYDNNREELDLSRNCRSHSVSNGSEVGSPKSTGNLMLIFSATNCFAFKGFFK